MSEKKPKIEFEIDVIQGSMRVRYTFDFPHRPEQMNFPIGTDEETIIEALKNRYHALKKETEHPTPPSGKKKLDWE